MSARYRAGHDPDSRSEFDAARRTRGVRRYGGRSAAAAAVRGLVCRNRELVLAISSARTSLASTTAALNSKTLENLRLKERVFVLEAEASARAAAETAGVETTGGAAASAAERPLLTLPPPRLQRLEAATSSLSAAPRPTRPAEQRLQLSHPLPQSQLWDTPRRALSAVSSNTARLLSLRGVGKKKKMMMKKKKKKKKKRGNKPGEKSKKNEDTMSGCRANTRSRRRQTMGAATSSSDTFNIFIAKEGSGEEGEGKVTGDETVVALAPPAAPFASTPAAATTVSSSAVAAAAVAAAAATPAEAAAAAVARWRLSAARWDSSSSDEADDGSDDGDVSGHENDKDKERANGNNNTSVRVGWGLKRRLLDRRRRAMSLGGGGAGMDLRTRLGLD